MAYNHIVVSRRADDYRAELKDRGEIWGCGNTANAAIGDLIRTFPHIFGIRIIDQTTDRVAEQTPS